jgi:hypothetical protein
MIRTFIVSMIVGGVIAMIFALRAIQQLWKLNQADRRLCRGNCPTCAYPLRFNDQEFWCSECGYKYPVSVDGASGRP